MATLRTSQVLKRWAAQFPNTRMPDDISEIELSQQHALQQADPELHSLLAGKATAELELAAVTGELADSVASLAEREDQARKQEVEQLIADGAFPSQGYYREDSSYVAGREGNLTAQLRISQLDPQRYESEKLKANPPQPNENAVSAEAAARMNAELAATRLQSLNSAQGIN